MWYFVPISLLPASMSLWWILCVERQVQRGAFWTRTNPFGMQRGTTMEKSSCTETKELMVWLVVNIKVCFARSVNAKKLSSIMPSPNPSYIVWSLIVCSTRFRMSFQVQYFFWRYKQKGKYIREIFLKVCLPLDQCPLSDLLLPSSWVTSHCFEHRGWQKPAFWFFLMNSRAYP